MLATTTRQEAVRQEAVARRYLVTGVVWATQRPKDDFAGARFEIGVDMEVTIRHRPGAKARLIRALALREAAQTVAPDCQSWEWERPLVTPLQGGAR